ncbi:MAG: hypothetical protein WA602_20575, partial [Silvibacterium sp.]
PNLLQRVIQPAAIEVNGLADFSVKIEPIRTGGQLRGLVTGFKVAWWRKSEHELKAAYEELKRAKPGRLARLRKEVETVSIPSLLSPEQEKINATVAAMREEGAPEADIQAFLKGQAA